MAIRVSISALLSSTALTGPKKVSAHYLLSAIPLAGSKRISSHSLVTSTPLAGAKRVEAHYLVGAISIHQGVYFNTLGPDNEIFGPFTWDINILGGLIPEHNPYRPNVPENLIDLGDDTYNYIRENQEILREQHNITQAGDSTFPWQLLLDTQIRPLYRLGAVGRFFHEDLGIMLARYVKFSGMVETPFPCAPVGLRKHREMTDWVVTNRFDWSHPNLAVGFIGSPKVPVDDTYGWVICEGACFHPIWNSGGEGVQGESFVWSATGEISNVGEGIVVGRRANKGPSPKIYAGQLWIRFESFSLDSIMAELAPLQATVDGLLADMEYLKDTLALETTLNGLQATLNKLQSRLAIEEKARVNGDSALHTRINNLDAVSAQTLANAVSSLQNSITIIQNSLQGQVTTAQATATEALVLAQSLAGIDSTLQEQISALAIALGILDERPKGRFPVVDGSVPPELMYLDDGSLIYTETF